MKDRNLVYILALPLFILSFIAFGLSMYLWHDVFTIPKFTAVLLTLTSAILSGAELIE